MRKTSRARADRWSLVGGQVQQAPDCRHGRPDPRLAGWGLLGQSLELLQGNRQALDLGVVEQVKMLLLLGTHGTVFLFLEACLGMTKRDKVLGLGRRSTIFGQHLRGGIFPSPERNHDEA